MTERSKGREASTEQSIEQLQARYHSLYTRQIEAKANLDNATKQLDALKKQARQSYGTDDVPELAKLLDAMKAENEEKRRSYQAELDRIEGELAGVEQKFAAAEHPPASEENSQ